MKNCIPCKTLKNCVEFQDFIFSNPNDRLYSNAAQSLTVTCPDGSRQTVNIPAGIVQYVLPFELGTPPYPNLALTCSDSSISVPVPDNATQSDLDALIKGLIQSCVLKLAASIGCPPAAQFYNTAQSYNPCKGGGVVILGAAPVGIITGNEGLVISAGVISSTISVADANSKTQQVLEDMFNTGNAGCLPLFLWVAPEINTTNGGTASIVPVSGLSNTFTSKTDLPLGSSNPDAYVQNGNYPGPYASLNYKGGSLNCNLHISVSRSASNADSMSGYVQIYTNSSGFIQFLFADISGSPDGEYDFPFTVPDTGGQTWLISLFAVNSINTGGTAAADYFLDMTGTVTGI